MKNVFILILCLGLVHRAFSETSEITVTANSKTESKPKPESESEKLDLDQVIQKALKVVIERSTAAKGRVAVMDFPSLEEQNMTALSAYVANKAGNRLIEAGRQVVDRAAVEKIISEQKLQQNALMDASTAAKVGRLAGAGVFIVGNYSILRKKFVLTVRALSVETGQFIAAAEETVPFHEDLLSEVTELHKRALVASGPASLDSGGSDGAATSAPSKKEIEFDTKICATINKGISFGKIVKIAYDTEMIDIDTISEDGLKGVTATDSTGEEKSPAYTFGQWTFTTDNWAFPRSSIGEAIKGKFGTYIVTGAWMYNGSNAVPGLDQCNPKPGWWTERRASGGKKKK